MSNDYVYMKITNDKYELPVAVADTASELANILGIKKSSIAASMYHARAGKRKEIYIKVYVGSDEDGSS